MKKFQPWRCKMTARSEMSFFCCALKGISLLGVSGKKLLVAGIIFVLSEDGYDSYISIERCR